MKIFKKLHSKTGASMLIALVFMMFCAFIGGAVLAAATANAGRIKSLNTEAQDYLDQRSVCMLLVDELQSGSYSKMSISVDDQLVTPMREHTVDGVAVFEENGAAVHTLTIRANDTGDGDNELQLLLYECAAMRYLQENIVDNKMQVTLEGFGDDINTVDDLSRHYNSDLQTFIMKITDPLGNNVDAFFRCSADEKTLYSLVIDFGEKTQMSIQMKATPDIGKTRTVDTNKTKRDNDIYTYFNRETYTSSTISWDTAFIEKGGLA